MSYPKRPLLFFSLISLLSIAILMCTALLGSYNFTLKIIVGTTLYFTLLYYFSNNYKSNIKIIALIFMLPILLQFLFINVLNFNRSWISLPSNIFLILGILFGYTYGQNHKVKSIIILPILIILWIFWGNNLMINKIQFGSFNQLAIASLPSNNFLVDSNFVVLKYELTNKSIVLDFWNSGCGPCYRLFPYIDSIQNSLDTSKFDIWLVNIPFNKEKKEGNFRLLNKFDYNIKQLFADDKNLADSFGIVAYPTTIVIKNNKIIFRGDFENFVKLQSRF